MEAREIAIADYIWHKRYGYVSYNPLFNDPNASGETIRVCDENGENHYVDAEDCEAVD